MRRLIAPILAIIVGSLAVTAHPVSAASGDVTSTTFTAPASVSGQSLMSSFADTTGGSFQVYRSGQTLTMIRVKQDGSTDSTFGGSGTVSIGVPSQLQSSGTMRVSGTTNPKTSSWSVVVSASGANQVTDSVEVALTFGTLTGANVITKAVTAATVIAQCALSTSGAVKYQSAAVFARRGGGVWLVSTCVTNSDSVASSVFIPITPTGDLDTAANSFSSATNYGGTGNCATIASIADPTSVAPAPELWVVRTESTRATCARDPGASEINALSALAVSSNGTVTRTQLSTSKLVATGVRIDPGGRPVFLAKDASDNSKVYISRLKTDGTLDTTVGTDGFLLLETGTVPAGASYLNATFAGVVTTEERVYFVIQLYDYELQTYQSNSTTPRTHGYRMALAAPAIGWATTYGTGGIGQRHSTILLENAFSRGLSASTGSTVDSTGRPVNFTFSETTAAYNVWATIAGATGGGEGGTGLGGFTRDTGGAPSLGSGNSSGSTGNTSGDVRIDSTIYTKLPKSTEVNTALILLTAKQARTQEIVSSTQRICVPSGRRVALVGIGTCSVRIRNKATGRTVKTLKTVVRTKTSTVGTTMVAFDPIMFSSKSSTISAKAYKQIREIATEVEGSAGVVIIGHATSIGNTKNFALSSSRADSVRRYLIKLNVVSPITKVSKGSTEPASTKKTPAGYAKNRRAVVYMIPSGN